MTPDLERALRELEIDWPATPDLAATVAARVADEPRPTTRARGWGRPRARLAAAVAAVLLVLAGGTLAVPEARSTVFRWLGIESVEIKRGTPRATPRASLDLGTPTTLAKLSVPALQAPGLGTPGVYATALPDGSVAASLVYDGPVLVQTFRARVEPFIEKTIGAGADVERLDVDGALALWITGPHGFAYEAPNDSFGYEQQRLAGRTLLVERADGLLLRVEGQLSRERALGIARSVQ
ncbi:hypothetical protein OJ997_10195 [Solirubrobacter phytolaccae]|uniref:DUF4367 domain-containing protein n=1 Tax=Solirubrobacter phytolaccae TaxID=1404360 RepID=A0A9X3SER6_9ACTN|nr:hypothetical protein [Solirubrobacter phytolaccae]MDA0180662.1 hypothetical protein [Solirubrobacter phytolaccae]